ncbi:MAG: hypothetical protein ACHQQS_06250 [Thermoanaerobaculales bacterium]
MKRHIARVRRVWFSIVLVVTVAVAPAACSRRSASPARGAAGQGPAPARRAPAVQGGAVAPMEKYVSPQGNFVVYRPVGWTVAESVTAPNAWSIIVDSPGGELETAMVAGRSDGGDVLAALRAVCAPLARTSPDLTLGNVRVTSDRARAVYDFAFTHPSKGRREGRGWLAVSPAGFNLRLCEVPAGRLEQAKALLLTILANVRIMRGGFTPATEHQAQGPLPLATYRLPDGSATIELPAGWTYQGFGAGQFFAYNKGEGASFSVGNVQLITPRLGVRPPGVLVAPFSEPREAWPLVTSSLLSNLRYLSVTPRGDLDVLIHRVYTGPVRSAELQYTFDSREGRRSRGFTLGISFGSNLDTNWRFWHMTLTAPEETFLAYVPTFTAMAHSYRIDDAFARNYIAQGMQHLRELQRQTSEIVTRNAQEIHSMMQAAYDERQRSQDYIDYLRTSTIRGEQDWVSGIEGGTVYHTDAWGTQNTATGQYYEGAPYDYYHFTGKELGGDLIAVDNRQVYDRVFGH